MLYKLKLIHASKPERLPTTHTCTEAPLAALETCDTLPTNIRIVTNTRLINIPHKHKLLCVVKLFLKTDRNEWPQSNSIVY